MIYEGIALVLLAVQLLASRKKSLGMGIVNIAAFIAFTAVILQLLLGRITAPNWRIATVIGIVIVGVGWTAWLIVQLIRTVRQSAA